MAPLGEPDAVVGRWDEQFRGIEVLLAEAKAAAKLMAERRSAQISAAVTGEVDLRHAAVESGA